MDNAEPIAIVGMQCLFPGAGNLETYWANILRGVDAVREVPPSRWNPSEYDLLHAKRGGFLDGLTDFDPIEHGIMPASVANGDPEQFLVFGVIHGALRDVARGRTFQATGRSCPTVNDDSAMIPRTDVVIGRGGYSGNTVEAAYLRLEFVVQAAELLGRLVPGVSPETLSEFRRLLATAFPHKGNTEMLASSIPNLTSGRISNRLDFQGANYTVDAACASGLVATDLVIRSLRERRCDMGVAAAVQLIQKPFFWYGFELLQAMSPTGACRTYSTAADGLVIGEGIGAIVLKRLEDAKRDGDRIYAIVRAIGTASDGKGVGILSPRREGQVLAIKHAYEESGIDPASISLLEGHGTAMPVGDPTEIASLHEVFGKEGRPSVALGSVKSMIGHLMPAAGMAGLIKTALAVYHRVLPPTLHVEEVTPELRESRFYVNTKTRPWIGDLDRVRRAGVNAFGFGGINTHAILEDVPNEEPRESYSPRTSELFVLTAPTRQAMSEKLTTWRRALPSLCDTELRDVCATAASKFAASEQVRLAIVAENGKDLEAKLARAAEKSAREASFTDDTGIFYAETPYPGKVAVLFPGLAFPGLAGGYTERLGELCLHFQEARWPLDFAEDYSLVADPTAPHPLSHQFFPPPLADVKLAAKLERELIWSKRTPLGQMMAGLSTYNLLVAAGLKADALAGFSLGEWTALVAARVLGMNDLKEMWSVWQSLGDVPDQLTGLWGMVGSSAEKVEAVLQRVPGIAAIIMDPTPTQTFFAGEAETVRAALELLRRDGVFVQEIPFPAIHTPLAGRIVEGLRAMKSAMPAAPPQARVYCGMNGQPYPDEPDTIRDWLIDSFVEPLRGKLTVNNMYHNDGVRIFVEVGIGGRSLQSLGRMLEGVPFTAMAMDAHGKSGLEQFHHVFARLLTLGVPMDLDYLFRNRPWREVSLSGQKTMASRTKITLDLAQPRARVPEESMARLREMIVPTTEPVAQARDTHSARPTGVMGEVMTTMEQFLRMQEQHETTETLMLQSYLAAQQQAMASFLQGSPMPMQAPPVAPAPAPAPSYPFTGEVVRSIPAKELETRFILDVAKHAFLGDHAFIKVPEHLRPPEERLPTLPMTFGVEIMIEMASRLVPGMHVIDCHDVEANKWIALVSQKTLAVKLLARRLSETEVEVELRTDESDRPAMRGKATLAPHFPVAPPVKQVPIEGPCKNKASDLYTIPLLFHGPRFYVVTEFVGTSDTTIIADLTLRNSAELMHGPTNETPLCDPVLLDGIGQAVGYKMLLEDWVTYPLRLGTLKRFMPTPPPGSVVRMYARYRKLDGRRVEFEADVVDASGRLWLRAEKWQIWRILWPKELATFSRRPRETRVGIPWPTRNPNADSCRMMSKLFGEISPEWIARYCLPEREWATYKAKPHVDWLLRRIVLKDAVRDWLKQHQGKLLLHLEIEIGDGANGEPILVSPVVPELRLSAASVEDEAIAVASTSRAVGIEMAIVGREIEGRFTGEEMTYLGRMDGDARAWKHRAVCARKAAAKALGQKPSDMWLIRAVAVDGIITIVSPTDGARYSVETSQDGDRVFAVVMIE